MRSLRVLRDNPILVLGVAVIGLIGWFVFDTTRPTEEPWIIPPLEPSTVEAVTLPPTASEQAPPGVVTAEVVQHLLPGMSRAAVEEIIGPPPADLVHPVAEVEGRLTYRATYLANLDPPEPNTVRPVSGRPAARPVPKSLISLEFDATQPGHPLLRVLVPTAAS